MTVRPLTDPQPAIKKGKPGCPACRTIRYPRRRLRSVVVAVQEQDKHQIDLAQPGGFQQPVARRAGRLGARDAGVHEFLDDKPARGGSGEVRSEEVNRACGTVRSLGRRPPARPQIPKTSVTVSFAPEAD